MNRYELEKFILESYGVKPDYPWEKIPDGAVFRHQSNNKWFALIMDVRKSRLGLSGEEEIGVVNLKCDPVLIGTVRQEKGIFPAYHMNKEHWISIALDGSADDERIKALVDLSFDLTDVKVKKKKN